MALKERGSGGNRMGIGGNLGAARSGKLKGCQMTEKNDKVLALFGWECQPLHLKGTVQEIPCRPPGG
jgi:hypothetical protein